MTNFVKVFSRYQFNKKISLLLAIAISGFITGCKKDTGCKALESLKSGKAMHEKSTVATGWYNLQTSIMLFSNPNPSPNVTARIFAYSGIALYESVRYGIPNSVALSTVLYQMPNMPSREKCSGYSGPVAANAALAYITRNVFAGLTPQNQASIDSLENANNYLLKSGSESHLFSRSQEFGRNVAAAIFDWSKTDGISRNGEPYTPPVFPGSWVPTPPLNAPAALPYLGSYRPLLATHLTGVINPFPYAYSEEPGSSFYNEVNFTYQTSKNASDEQKATARFWADVGVSTGYSTPGHHLRILTNILEKNNASLGNAAIAYAKAGIVLRDALIMTWRSKYTYNLLRPVTYVQKLIEPGWLPYLGTPNHPEYPAAHAIVSSAFMETMAGLYGDNYSFTDNTYVALGIPARSYASFSDAAKEAGWSRIYGGIHYRASVEAGLLFGKQIGKRVRNLKLQR